MEIDGAHVVTGATRDRYLGAAHTPVAPKTTVRIAQNFITKPQENIKRDDFHREGIKRG